MRARGWAKNELHKPKTTAIQKENSVNFHTKTRSFLCTLIFYLIQALQQAHTLAVCPDEKDVMLDQILAPSLKVIKITLT
ncbi:hypothetical protein V2G26_011285 [Clonostachys chloroleuca]